MNRGILAIYDCETEYAYRLMEYLNRSDEFGLEARVFTNRESLQEHLAEQDLDILLLGDGIELEIDASHRVKERILLTGERERTDTLDWPAIYKYQSADQIRKEILACYAKQEEVLGNQFSKEMSKKVVGIISPCGGSGNSTFSILMGQTLSQQKKVLLLNLEAIPGQYGADDSTELSAGISDLIYYVKQGKPNFGVKLQSMVRRRGNLDYILPADHYADLYELSRHDVQLLIEQLCKQSIYERIILDIGFVSDSTFDFLNCCSDIYMLVPENGIAHSKEEAFQRMLRMWEGEGIIQKIKKIQMPFHDFTAQRNHLMETGGTKELDSLVCQLVEEGGL